MALLAMLWQLAANIASRHELGYGYSYGKHRIR